MKKTTLSNGFVIYTETIDVAQAVTFSIYVKSGSYHEVEPFGAAHLLEHMVFKGTTTRNAHKISEDIEQYGGLMNAETSFEHTRYFTVIPFENWKKGADVIYDICFNSTIPEKEFALEKKVVQEELKMYSDDSSSHVSDMLLTEMFKSYPNRQTLGGTVQSVGDITRNELINFRDEKYKPDNMFAVVTGNVNHSDVVDFFKENMSSQVGEDSAIDYRKRKFSYDILNSKTVTKERNIEQAHLCWGLFAPMDNSSDAVVIDFISVLLGGSSTSRLYKIIREEMGLAYTVSVGYMGMSDVGVVTGYAGLEKSKVEEVKKIVVSEFDRLKKDFIPNDEMERVKNYIVGKQKIKMDSLSFINSYIGGAVITSVSPNPEEYIKGIKGVTKEDIKRVAKKYFIKENWQFSEIMPK